MTKGKAKKNIRLAVEICIAVFLLLLMSYQATGEKIHEWIGIGMTLSVILHQILNLSWYRALLSGKGKWTSYRKIITATDILLLITTLLTAFSGMSMSAYAVPFLYGMTKLTLGRRMHLALSHWCFILAGIHLGLHLPAMETRYIKDEKTQRVASTVFTCFAGIGIYLFLRSRILSYIFLTAAFAYFEPGKPRAMVFIEYICIFILWSFIGYMFSMIDRKKK